ncbi:MAG: hypothetical protein ACRC8S_17720 [Fimbriiglobus sp.]
MARDVDDLYEDETPPTAAEVRSMLRLAAEYRQVCDGVRRSSFHSLFWGALMVGLWYAALPPKMQDTTFGLVFLGLGVVEFTVGLWNYFFPAPEGMLLEGLVLIIFAVNSATKYLIMMKFSPFLLFAVFMGFSGIQHIRGYFQIRKLFPIRPSRKNLRWLDELRQDVRYANPEGDPLALDLPTQPPFRAKLLGENAIFLANGTTDLIVLAGQQVRIVPHEAAEGEIPEATLYFGGEPVSDFTLDPDNWRNYSEWKATMHRG